MQETLYGLVIYIIFNYMPENNYIVLPIYGDDEITKIAYFKGSHMIFTRNSIYRMSGTFGLEDFSIVLINDSIGCIAPDTVKSINNTLVFMSIDGLYAVKQNYYMEGLENVDKIDRQIYGLIENYTYMESLIYGEQLLLFEKDVDGYYTKTVKQYYNMQLGKNTYPFSVDKYKITPTNINKLGTNVYSIRNGYFYQYDVGYTDFMLDVYEQYEIPQHTYRMIVETPNYMLGYPTHNKKI